MASLGSSIKHTENLHQSFSNSFQRLERIALKSFYEVTNTLISKSDKDNTKKEKYRLITLMNIDPKLLNKVLPDQIQKHIKRSYIMIKSDSSYSHKPFGMAQHHKSIYVIYHINKRKDKNLMIISTDAKKVFDKIQHPFIIKTLTKVGIEGTYFNIMKAYPLKLIFNKGDKNIQWGTMRERQQVVLGQLDSCM